MDIESRLLAAESAIASIREDVAVIRANYVTKADLESLRTELRLELEKVRLDMERSLHNTTKWMVGMVLTVLIGFSGLTFSMFNLVKPFVHP